MSPPATGSNGLLDRLGAWPIRASWLLLPLFAGPVFDDALSDASRPVQVVASTGLWGLWAAVLVATLVPTTVTLTVVRILVPGALLAGILAVLWDDAGPGWQEAPPGGHVVAVSWAAVTVVAAFLLSTSAVFVNGSSYGDEVRLPLRVPGPLLLGPIEATWLITIAGGVMGPLLLATKHWVAGGLALALGVPATIWGARVLHTLSRRWTVFVPGGLVLHDPLSLAHPVLLRRGTITSLDLAPAGTEAVDLTGGALGLAVEARVQHPVPLLLTAGRGGRGRQAGNEVVETDTVMFSPTRPGVFLVIARARRL